MDDILHSADDVDRAYNLLLALGSFHVKYWVVSGCHESRDVNVMESNCEKILGLMWKPKEDYFFLHCKRVLLSKSKEDMDWSKFTEV